MARAFQSYAIQRLRQLFGAGAVNLTFVAPLSASPAPLPPSPKRTPAHFLYSLPLCRWRVPPAPLPLPQNQNARGHRCFYSIFHADISLCRQQGHDSVSADGRQKANHRNGKGRESGPSCCSFLRDDAKLLLLVDAVAELNFRRLAQVAHQRFESDLGIVLGDP